MKSLNIFFFVILGAAGMLLSQTKTGTTIGQFLLIEPSSRIAAMGNAGVALSTEATSSYYNPASLGVLNSTQLQFSNNNWFAGITHRHLSAAVKISDESVVGLAFTSLSSGDIAVRTAEQPGGTGEYYDVSNVALGVQYGQKISNRFSAGVQITFVQERIWHSELSTFAFNFGTLYQIQENGLQLGASISNFGLRSKYDGRDLRIRYDLDPSRYGDNSSLPGVLLTEEFSLPVVFRVGFGYPLALDDNNRITFAIDAFHPSDNSESVSMGGEYSFMRTFSLRAGYQHLFQTDSEVGLTAGGGVEWDIEGYVIRIDYAWADHNILGAAQRMTMGLEF